MVALNLAGAAALLIWAVRLVRTGFERAFGAKLRLWLRRSTANRAAAAGSGLAAAILLQSSTAVALLLASFVAAGAVGGHAGLAVILGADLGSAIVAQLLTTRLALVEPVLLLAGVVLFLRGKGRVTRMIGRILIGFGLIFVSLNLIRAASLPIVDAGAFRSVMTYLAGDPATAFVLSALFTWAVHSSVAAILLFATLAAQGLVPIEAAAAMVLGANFGGSMIAALLTSKAEPSVRRVIWSNVALRGGGAVLALVLIMRLGLPHDWLARLPGQEVLSLHLTFNLLILLAGLPLVGPILQVAQRLMPDPPLAAGARPRRHMLDPALADQPARAFPSALRAMVEIGDRVEAMLRQAILLMKDYDEAAAQRMRDDAAEVAEMSLELRLYLTRIRGRDGDETVKARAFDMSGIAVNIEAAADMIAGKLVELAERRSNEDLAFSDAGWRELTDFHDLVLRNVQHAISVLITEDVGLARELVEQKESLRTIEQELERRHMTRLREGVVASIETSAIHLEMLRSLKGLNTNFAMIAYPLLQDKGALLSSRLAGR